MIGGVVLQPPPPYADGLHVGPSCTKSAQQSSALPLLNQALDVPVNMLFYRVFIDGMDD